MQALKRGRGQDVDGCRVEKSTRLKSVTVSRCSKPSMSSQYSSDVSLLNAPASRRLGPIFSSRTSRLSTAERMRAASGCSVLIVVPSGSVIRADGTFSPAVAESVSAAP
jgi:hypothetical protein